MANINGIVNGANERVRIALDTEVVRNVEIVEQGVLDHYFTLLEPLQRALDMLYNELENPNFTKLHREEFDELVYENFQARLESVMIEYLQNAHDLTLELGAKEKVSDEFCEFIKLYKEELLAQGVKQKRVNMESRKILFTIERRYYTMLNTFGRNMDKQMSSYCEYLLNCINFFRINYTITIDSPKEDIEIVMEREGYVKVTTVRDMIELLLSEGYTLTRVSGSHHIYSNGIHSVPLPIHGKDMNKHLAYGIQKQIREK